jgi:RNA polymerase sigma-70 factor, ECF subfamily
MEQRITRAKARIAEAGLPFETPGPSERAERLEAVQSMIYLIFNEGYSDPSPESERAALCDESIRLGRLLLRLFSSAPELMGLLALMLLQHSRQRARFSGDGSLVLLEQQDRSLWDHNLIREGLALLDKALLHRQSGPYQIQAAIAALHARAKKPEDTDWKGIEQLYQALERHAPSPVVTLNRAVAVSKVDGPGVALALVETLAEPLSGYFYFHGLRGALLKQLGHVQEARVAYQKAISLAGSAAEAAHIRQHLDELEKQSSL